MTEKVMTHADHDEYRENIINVKLIEPRDIANLEDDTYIFFGRATCPYCRKFVKEIPSIEQDIFYIDTENTDLNIELQAVRDQFDVKTVPTFIKRKSDGSYNKLNRDIRQSIAEFIEENKN
ncbi:MAG: hypothetical protein FWE43_04785 [Streptococcaceae bacterium]|nr:hypothetical protein [Streptococcaceae bacterium]MCL2681786.1 hypothetical protein [Streptococcaceae bacterium]